MISITVSDSSPGQRALMLLQTDKPSRVTLMAVGTNQNRFTASAAPRRRGYALPNPNPKPLPCSPIPPNWGWEVRRKIRVGREERGARMWGTKKPREITGWILVLSKKEELKYRETRGGRKEYAFVNYHQALNFSALCLCHHLYHCLLFLLNVTPFLHSALVVHSCFGDTVAWVDEDRDLRGIKNELQHKRKENKREKKRQNCWELKQTS